MSKFEQLKRIFLNGIFDENPTFRLVLGMCPTLAITYQASNGIGMGLAVTNITIWGLIDQPFLAKDNYSYRQNGPYCGLFDERMNYKESFDLVYEELMAE